MKLNRHPFNLTDWRSAVAEEYTSNFGKEMGELATSAVPPAKVQQGPKNQVSVSSGISMLGDDRYATWQISESVSF